MADMHVLKGDGATWRVAMHIAIPPANNAAGIPWPLALVNSGRATTILPDGDGTAGTIDATEKAAILAGDVLEHVEEFRIESGGSSATEVLAALRQFYFAKLGQVTADLQRTLKYFGATESKS